MSTLRAVLEAESGVAVDAQGPLLKDGKPLAAEPSASLASAGLADGDLLALGGAGGAGPPSTANGGAARRRVLTATELLAAARADPAFASRLPPPLQAALAAGDAATIQALLDQAAAAGGGGGSQGGGTSDGPSHASVDALNADPFDPAAQAAIEARVRQAAVDASLEAALEHHPEAFADVVMLYVHLTINGRTLAAFVDSGAQRSIMSVETAEEAGLSHLVDTRFAGVAVGVGSGKIVGRIHAVPCKAGTGPDAPYLTISLTVMDQKGMPFLLGLDMLRRFRASIDLGAGGGGVLRFPAPVGVELAFLPEHALPASARAGGAGFGGPREEEAGKEEGGGGAAAAAAAAAAPGPAPSPATAPPAPAPAPAPAAPPSASVARLVDLGFSAAAAQAALNAVGGNEEMAASLLFEGGMG